MYLYQKQFQEFFFLKFLSRIELTLEHIKVLFAVHLIEMKNSQTELTWKFSGGDRVLEKPRFFSAYDFVVTIYHNSLEGSIFHNVDIIVRFVSFLNILTKSYHFLIVLCYSFSFVFVFVFVHCQTRGMILTC